MYIGYVYRPVVDVTQHGHQGGHPRPLPMIAHMHPQHETMTHMISPHDAFSFSRLERFAEGIDVELPVLMP